MLQIIYYLEIDYKMNWEDLVGGFGSFKAGLRRILGRIGYSRIMLSLSGSRSYGA